MLIKGTHDVSSVTKKTFQVKCRSFSLRKSHYQKKNKIFQHDLKLPFSPLSTLHQSLERSYYRKHLKRILGSGKLCPYGNLLRMCCQRRTKDSSTLERMFEYPIVGCSTFTVIPSCKKKKDRNVIPSSDLHHMM